MHQYFPNSTQVGVLRDTSCWVMWWEVLGLTPLPSTELDTASPDALLIIPSLYSLHWNSMHTICTLNSICSRRVPAECLQECWCFYTDDSRNIGSISTSTVSVSVCMVVGELLGLKEIAWGCKINGVGRTHYLRISLGLQTRKKSCENKGTKSYATWSPLPAIVQL